MGERGIFHEVFSMILLKKEGYYELSWFSRNFSTIFVQNCLKILRFSTEEPMLFVLLSVVNLHSNYYKTFSIHFHNWKVSKGEINP